MPKTVKIKEEKLSPQTSRGNSRKETSRRASSSSDADSSDSDRSNSRDVRLRQGQRMSSQIHVSSKVESGHRHRQSTDSKSKSRDSSRSKSPGPSNRSSRPSAWKRSSDSPSDSSSDRHGDRRSVSPANRDRVRNRDPRSRGSRYSPDSDERRKGSCQSSRPNRNRDTARSVSDDRRRKESPDKRRRKVSPSDRRRNGSPDERRRNISPEDRRRNISPADRRRNRSPEDRRRNRSPEHRNRSLERRNRSPERQNRSPDDRRRIRSPDTGRHHPARRDGYDRTQQSPSTSPASDASGSSKRIAQPTRSRDDRRRNSRSSSGSSSSGDEDRRQKESDNDSSSTSSNSDVSSRSDSEAAFRGRRSQKEASRSRSSSTEQPSKGDRKSATKKKKSSRDRRGSPPTDAVSKSAAGEGWIMGKLKQLQEDKVAKKGCRRKEKEILKLMETPEEKRLRRLLKKEAKERKRKERMGWDKDYMHYTNTDNPFGDANLLETFVWQKKLERDGITDVSTEILEQRSRMKQEENKYELEKVKKRRLEREQERAQRDEEMALMQSQKEAAQFMEWEKQEDTFHLQQALLRSKIRIEDGRAKPIDLLAKYISTEDEDLAVDMHEPYTYLNGLTIRDLEDLLEDIKVYMELEKGKNLDYWNDITIIVDDELYKLRKVDAANREHFGDRREGIHVSVNSEVNSVFKGKTHSQLAALHNQIIKKITGGEEGIDIGYWESLLSQLKAQMARARLRDRHQENLRRKLFQLKQEQGVESEPTFPIVEDSTSASTVAAIPGSPNAEVVGKPQSPSRPGPSRANTDPKFIAPPELNEGNEDSNQQADFDTILTEEDLRDHSMEEYVSGGYSPKLTRLDSLEPGTLLIDPYDDAKCLDYARNQLIGTGRLHSELTPEERAFEIEARTGMNDDEAMFSVETPLDHKMYLWSDKYRPRKPRYFNRVHTGFEWNKYNQTHYDMDNPPPKIVQGYKFNIFYPDLIDKSITPEYTLTPCPENKDFAILRFHAGPPYEDIAFKIVNREWEYSYKRGFRCQFHNNIFQLWFHFKRYRYRR